MNKTETQEIFRIEDKISVAKNFVMSKLHELDLSKTQLEAIKSRFDKIKIRELYPEEMTTAKAIFISHNLSGKIEEEIALENEIEINDIIHEFFHAVSSVFSKDGGVKKTKNGKVYNRGINEALTVYFTNEFKKQNGYYFITDIISEMVKGINSKTLLKNYILGDIESIKEEIASKYKENSTETINEIFSGLDVFADVYTPQNCIPLKERPRCAIGIAMHSINLLADLYTKEKIRIEINDWKEIYDNFVTDINLDFNLSEFIFNNKPSSKLSKKDIKQIKAEKYDLIDTKTDLKSNLAQNIQIQINKMKIKNGFSTAIIKNPLHSTQNLKTNEKPF